MKDGKSCENIMSSQNVKKKCCGVLILKFIYATYILFPICWANNEDFFASTSDIMKLFALEQELFGKLIIKACNHGILLL